MSDINLDKKETRMHCGFDDATWVLIEATASIVGIALTSLVITGRACVTDTTYEVYVVQRVAFSMFGITGSNEPAS